MNWYEIVFELIDMRSFSNLWFWIALAAVWSTTSHYVLGVPFDMVGRAAKHGGQSERDLETLVRIRVNRLLFIARVSGLWIVGFGAAILTALMILGFVYQVEFAQAVFLIAAPMTLVGLLSLSTARLIEMADLSGAALRLRLTRHRQMVQVIGMVSIFVTAVWGMYQNMNVGPLGG
ncbi:component of SufBCD complex [Maribius pontilimi]|uniref:Component of SufBCD complex n=1 Tax=Palleronia pontilimi TaxID=1964209 RepID=A0A934IHA8_9RHOB|nr:component of SufBCD complex [Palleronia pontilimi]MBJ3762898.1 component of SufBCD complex [Palleronia pontilimi]